MDQETLAMQLIVHAGNAKSKVMQAVAAARVGDAPTAEATLQECRDAMTEAHRQQTDILQLSLDSPDEGVMMLMAHAQDHMMNAITALDLGQEMCAIYERLNKLEKKEGIT